MSTRKARSKRYASRYRISSRRLSMDFREAQKSGILTVYTDTVPELEREVKEYNELMSVCRKK